MDECQRGGLNINRFLHSFCSVYMFLACLVKAMAQTLSEPDYKHIVYGSVWKHVIIEPPDTLPDIAQARKNVLQFIHARHSDILSDDFSVTCTSKLDLWFTESNKAPYAVTQFTTTNDGDQNPVSLPLSFGSTYNFKLTFTKNDTSYVHFITITKSVHTGNFYIYAHTFYADHQIKHQSKCCDSCPKEKFSPNLHIFSNLVTNKNLELHSRYECSPAIASQQVSHAVPLTCGNGDDSETCGALRDKNIPNDRGFTHKADEDLKVMSYNIWNFFTYLDNGEYSQRLNRISQQLRDNDPDIVGFQEVRLQTPAGGHLGPSQMDHLMSMMPQYQFVFQPAQIQGSSLKEGRTEEGVAIFSKYPILHHEYMLLFRNQSNSADQHQRVCLHAVIQVPSFGKIHVFNTHFSLGHEAREVAVKQIQEYMEKYGDSPVILMGDLNATPEEKAIKMFTAESGMLDVWDLLNPSKPGFTFSCLDEEPSRRIDYIFVNRLANITAKKMEVVPDKIRDEAASDHRAVLATFTCKAGI